MLYLKYIVYHPTPCFFLDVVLTVPQPNDHDKRVIE